MPDLLIPRRRPRLLAVLVLLMRRDGSGYADGLLAFPAGHVDRGETPTASIIRDS